MDAHIAYRRRCRIEATYQYISRSVRESLERYDWSCVSTGLISDGHHGAVILMSLTWSRARPHRRR